MKKICFITNFYPPVVSAASPQIARIATFLRQSFDVQIITVDSPQKDDSLLLNLNYDNVKIIKKNKLNAFISNCRGNIIKKKLLPDLFYFNHYDLLTECKKTLNGYDNYIVTFGAPMSTHMVGFKLKKYFNLRWIAVFYDPWTDNCFNKYNFFTNMLNQKYERTTIECSDAAIFSSKSYLKLMQTKYMHCDNKFKYIPLSCSVQNNTENININKNNKIIIRYLGSFYYDRQPYCLFKALTLIPIEYLQMIQIELIGNFMFNLTHDIKTLGLDEVVFTKNPVSYLESIKLMTEADVLLLIDAPDYNIFLPSKLVEYINIGKPILAITPDGESKDILTQSTTIHVIADVNDIRDIADKLQKLIYTIHLNLIKIHENQPKNRFSIDVVGHQFKNCIDQL